MSQKPIIAVTGATGAQGGGLVRAIQSDPDSPFRVRALTRDANSGKAQALAALGAEVVQADIDDPASIQRAFEGAHAAFCVTFFWDHFSPEKELSQAASMAAVARTAKLQYVVWSTLEDTRNFISLDNPSIPTLHGKYKVPHFDAKGQADALFRDSGIPATCLLTSFYWDNFIHFGMGPTAGPDGRLAITFPMGDKKLPGIAAEDIGRCAYGLFLSPQAFAGRTVGIAGEHLSGAEMAAAFSRALGRDVHYNDVPADVYRSFGFPGADDLGNMFQFKRDYNEAFRAARDVDFSRSLNPRLQNFETWLAANAARIPMPA